MARASAVYTTPSRLLNVSLWISAGIGLLVVALGLGAIVQDLRVQGEEWDGAGQVLGAIAVTVGLIWATPHVILAFWLIRARRDARSLAPVSAASLALDGGLLFLLLAYEAAGGAEPTTLIVPIAGCTLVLLAGALVAGERGPSVPRQRP